MMSSAYMNRILEIMAQSYDLRRSAIGIARQASYAAGGAALGGVVAGSFGALFGGVVGSVLGYMRSDPYDSLLTAIRALSDEEKVVVAQKVQQLVGAVSVEEFIRWIQNEEHRQLLLSQLRDAVKWAYQ